MSESLDKWLLNVSFRLEKGAHEYGDQSFDRSPRELAQEIEEELLDVVGWIYVMWVRAARAVQLPPGHTEREAREEFFAALRERYGAWNAEVASPDPIAETHAAAAMRELEDLAVVQYRHAWKLNACLNLALGQLRQMTEPTNPKEPE